MEDTNLQELKEIENVTKRELFLRFSGRGCNLASEIVKNRRNHVGNCHFYTYSKSQTSAKELDSKNRVAQA